MILTYKEGNRQLVKNWKYFKCSYCKWEGAADSDSYKADEQYMDIYYTLPCPCCRHNAKEVQDAEQLNKLDEMLASEYPF